MASLSSVETGGTMREVLCNVDPDLQGRLVEYLPENLDYQRRHRARPGEAILGEALATADEMRRTAAYADIFRPSGAIHFCGVSLPMHGDRFHPLPCTADRNRARSASAGGSGYLAAPPPRPRGHDRRSDRAN